MTRIRCDVGSCFNSFQQKELNVKTDPACRKSQLVAATRVRNKTQAVLDSGAAGSFLRPVGNPISGNANVTSCVVFV